MRQQMEHNGRQAVVETRKVGHGYLWSYVLDGHIYREGRDRPLRSEELALAEGLREAIADINRGIRE